MGLVMHGNQGVVSQSRKSLVMAPARAAYLLESGGKVRVVIYKVDTKDHATQVLETLEIL